jgi:HAD superfamily hydrolase (TIGR01490 family)
MREAINPMRLPRDQLSSLLAPKPLAFFDIDNTLYDGHSYFEFIPENFAAGVIPSSTIAESLFLGVKYKNGLSSYEQTLHDTLDIYARGLRGQSLQRLEFLAENFYAKSDKFFHYVEPLFAKLRHTHEIVLISGEPQFMAAGVAKRLGVSHYRSTIFASEGDILTGQVASYVAFRSEKEALLRQNYPKERLDRSLAVGDSEGDIGMLEAVRRPICINPTAGLMQHAQERGWVIANDKKFTSLFKKHKGV